MERHLRWDGLVNARDLGGLRTRDGRRTQPRRVIRSESLQTLSPTGQAALLAYGVRTIIDLRLPAELAAGPNPFAEVGDHAVSYLHRSFNDLANESELLGAADLAEHYRINLAASGRRIAAILEAIAEAGDGAVLIHCQGGQDRTGLIAAMLLDLAGVPENAIVADYLLTRENRRASALQYVECGPGDRAEREREIAFFTPTEAALTGALAYLSTEHGGVEGYLRGHGLSVTTISALRGRLLNE